MEFYLNDIIPDSLYKYRDYKSELHRRIITHQEIYFANPSEFLVPYDCKYQIDRKFIKDEQNRRKYYSKSLRIPNLNDPQIDCCIESNPITDELIDEMEIVHQNKLDQLIGVFSGSLTNRNTNLWKVFGGNNKGFCVELNLLETFPIDFGSKGYVKYVRKEDLPKRKVLDVENDNDFFFFATDLIFNLPIEFSEEQEYRIEKLFFNDENRVFKIKKNCIKSITLGYKMSQSNRDEIIELIRKHLSKVIIKKLKYDRQYLKEIIC